MCEGKPLILLCWHLGDPPLCRMVEGRTSQSPFLYSCRLATASRIVFRGVVAAAAALVAAAATAAFLVLPGRRDVKYVPWPDPVNM